MVFFKGVLIGLGAVLLGCVAAPVALMMWAGRNSAAGGTTVSFNPMGMANHLSHSLGCWMFITVLFTAGFVPTVFLRKR